MRLKLLISIIIGILVFSNTAFCLGQEIETQNEFLKEEVLEARVTKIIEEKRVATEFSDEEQLYQKLELEVSKGSLEGKSVVVENGVVPMASVVQYKAGDRVILNLSQDFEGNEVLMITDYVRRGALGILFILFVFLAVAVAKWRGLSSLLGMGISFLIIFSLILPLIFKGADPVWVVMLGSVLIIPISFYLAHGLNRKTTVAIVGTLISLAVTVILAKIFVEAGKLTGFASEEAGFLQAMRPGTVQIKNLLLAGIIIGVLGVLDDVTVSQAAIVEQLREANPNLKQSELYSKAMKVGQDHISSMVNTLILVYTGASLPLLLLFIDSPRPFSEVVNYEIIADEIVRTMVGSIGLMLAVPITTLIAAINFGKK